MMSSMVRTLKSRQIGMVQTFHLISGTAGTPADSGYDRAFVDSVTDNGTGSYTIDFKQAARQNLHIAGIVAVTPGAILSVSAIDKDSVTITSNSNAGVEASLVVQDITYTARVPGTDGNSITIAYTAGGTAGSEVVSVTGTAISVQIETAVSTATQVLAKVVASPAAMALVSASISGTAGDAQVAAVAAPLAGGANVVAMDADFYLSVVHSTQLNYNF